MAEYFPLYNLIDTVLSVFLILIEIVIAGIAFFRLRASPAGLLVGGSYAGFGCLIVLTMIVFRLVMPVIGYSGAGYMISQVLMGLLDLLLTLLLAVGVGLIPMSVRKLALRS